jgi:hypothetical protein
VLDSELGGQSRRVLPLHLREARAHRSDGQQLPAVAPALLLRDPKEKRAIHAAGEGHDQAQRQLRPQRRAQRGFFRRQASDWDKDIDH